MVCSACRPRPNSDALAAGRRRPSARFSTGRSIEGELVWDGEVLDSLRRYVLDPEVVDRSLHLAIRSLQASLNQRARDVVPLNAELEQVNRELARLVDAIAAGGDLPSMLAP